MSLGGKKILVPDFTAIINLLRIQDKEYETSIIHVVFGSINTGRDADEPKVKHN